MPTGHRLDIPPPSGLCLPSPVCVVWSENHPLDQDGHHGDQVLSAFLGHFPCGGDGILIGGELQDFPEEFIGEPWGGLGAAGEIFGSGAVG